MQTQTGTEYDLPVKLLSLEISSFSSIDHWNCLNEGTRQMMIHSMLMMIINSFQESNHDPNLTWNQ